MLDKVCGDKVCVEKVFVDKVYGDKVWRRAEEEKAAEEEPGIQNQKQEPHTKMWGTNSTCNHIGPSARQLLNKLWQGADMPFAKCSSRQDPKGENSWHNMVELLACSRFFPFPFFSLVGHCFFTQLCPFSRQE